MQLNRDQVIGKEKILRFLESDENFFLLEGSGGTGKTTLITEIFKNDKFKDTKIVFSATTNKAVSVLEKYSKLTTKNVSYLTIHKLLKITRKINESGKEIYTFADELETKCSYKDTKSIKNFNIIIIDEASMINLDLLKTLETISRKIKGKIIFMGDRNQLPPINERISKIFNKHYNGHNYTLTIIERCKNDIVKYSNSIKDNTKIKKSKLNPKDIQFTKMYKEWIQNYLEDTEDSVILSYTNKNRSKINKYIRSILFPNETTRFSVNDKIIFNNYYKTDDTKFYASQISTIKSIKEEYHNFNALPIENILNLKISLKNPTILTKIINTLDKSKSSETKSNETIETIEKCPICLETEIDVMEQTFCGHVFCSQCIKLWLKKNKCCPLCRCTVVENKIEIKNYPVMTKIINDLKTKMENMIFKVWKVEIEEDTIMIVSDSSIKKYKEFCKYVENKLIDIKTIISKKTDKFNYILLIRLWEFYYDNYIDCFADIDYGYCITVHKSQGSTYKNVFVDIMDIVNYNQQDTRECVYTAMTRASKRLCILK